MPRPETQLRLVQPSGSRIGNESLQFTTEQKRDLFKGMVVSELESGFLRYSKRQELMRYASILGIGEFDASLLIAEAQFRSGDIEPASFHTPVDFESLVQPDKWSIPLRLGFVLVAAAFIDLLLIWWLFH